MFSTKRADGQCKYENTCTGRWVSVFASLNKGNHDDTVTLTVNPTNPFLISVGCKHQFLWQVCMNVFNTLTFRGYHSMAKAIFFLTMTPQPILIRLSHIFFVLPFYQLKTSTKHLDFFPPKSSLIGILLTFEYKACLFLVYLGNKIILSFSDSCLYLCHIFSNRSLTESVIWILFFQIFAWYFSYFLWLSIFCCA